MFKSHTLRKIVSLFILALCFTSMMAGQNANYNKVTKSGNTYYIYKVKTGEGLYAISRLFDVPVQDLIKSNPGSENGLQNGQELLVPVLNEIRKETETKQNVAIAKSNQSGVFQHTVSRGETLYSIAFMYNTTVNEIKKLNQGITDNISDGQIIIIPQQKKVTTSEENYIYHTIQPKETLYSVSKKYSVKPEQLIESNSGLSVETFQIGKTVRIPTYTIYSGTQEPEVQMNNEVHKVKKGETLFSISQKYGLKVADIQKANPSLADGLKTNMELMIPLSGSVDQNELSSEIDADRLLSQISPKMPANVIRVGLLLPFLDTSDNQHLRLQEYYEGFLMSVEKMKRSGVNIEVYVFDISSKAKLESLLGTMEMQSLHLIIGGMTDEQIDIISNFSEKHNVKYVIPFSSKNNDVLSNDKIFQVNSPHLYLFSKASKVFTDEFKDKNVILVNVPEKKDKSDFIAILKSDLKNKNIKHSSVNLTSELYKTLLPLLSKDVENIIVPTTGDSGTLKEIMHALSEVFHENEGVITTRLFGYPEWQTYDSDMKSLMHNFGTYFYTSFFVDDHNSETQQFVQDFRKWYGRDMIETYPKYGLFGYDTGLFFINAIDKFGVNFEKNMEQIQFNSALQFAFNFERVNNWGGFINSGMFLINYNTDNKTYKINKSR